MWSRVEPSDRRVCRVQRLPDKNCKQKRQSVVNSVGDMRGRHQRDFVFCKQVQLGDTALRYQTHELVCPFHSVERLDDKTSWIADAVAEMGE
jgi:hypothetical protein